MEPAQGKLPRAADGQLVKTLRRRMLEAAIDLQVRTVTVIIDHDARYQSYSKPELGKTILKWLYERVSMHLGDHDDLGIMIADKPGGGPREEKRWLAETLELTATVPSTSSPAASSSRCHRRLAPRPSSSAGRPDRGGYYRAIAGNPSALELGPFLAKLMHRHSLGDVNGAGLVIFPDSNYNLLYHCFGETGESKPGMMSGVTLPWKGWPYATDNGLGNPVPAAGSDS